MRQLWAASVRAAAQQIVPSHAAGVIAEAGRCRTAGRKLSEIDGVRYRSGKPKQKAGAYQKLHAVTSPLF